MDFLEFNNTPIFESHTIEGWTDEEVAEAERLYKELDKFIEEKGVEGLKHIDENLLGKIIGGAAGFLIGPSVGKIIAKALGVEKGILYDMFTSRLVSTALGAAISKQISSK